MNRGTSNGMGNDLIRGVLEHLKAQDYVEKYWHTAGTWEITDRGRWAIERDV